MENFTITFQHFKDRQIWATIRVYAASMEEARDRAIEAMTPSLFTFQFAERDELDKRIAV